MSNGQWTRLPDMLSYTRWEHQAGLVTYPDESQAIVVYGGTVWMNDAPRVEIFHLANMTWTPGPTMPYISGCELKCLMKILLLSYALQTIMMVKNFIYWKVIF